MPRLPTAPWPTTRGSVFFGDATNSAQLSRAISDGRIRRIARGVYSADLTTDAVELVARNRWSIVRHLVPDALIADRSAAAGGLPVAGRLTIGSAERRRDIVLPDLIISPRDGPGPLGDDPPWAGGLRITSEARTLVDNLAPSRTRGGLPARTLSRSEIEDWLVGTAQRRPDDWLLTIRARALEICDQLSVPDRRPLVEDLVGTAIGTRAAKAGSGQLLRARTAGREYDPERVGRFDELAQFLVTMHGLDIPTQLPSVEEEASTCLPFFEAYFSNFIEGTEFSIDEAEEIVTSGDIPEARPADAHDILGTFEAVADPELRAATPSSTNELFSLLERRHRLVMGGRPDKRPGQFKETPNQAGSYVFVTPELVVGTLAEGFERLLTLPEGLPRALFELFLISEVHPYDDGNGRVARAAMCAQLSADHQARIVIPIVFRNEYMAALRALSRDGRSDLFVRTLVHAWRWTAAVPWQDRAAVDGFLMRTNALLDSTDAERSGVRLELP